MNVKTGASAWVGSALGILVLVCCPLVWSASPAAAAAHSFGFTVFANEANLTGDTDVLGLTVAHGLSDVLGGFWDWTTPRRGGYGAELYFTSAPLAPGLTVQEGLQYAQRGVKFAFIGYEVQKGPEPKVDETLKLDYAEVSVLGRYEIASQTVSPVLYLGPVIGVRVASVIEARGNSSAGASMTYYSSADMSRGFQTVYFGYIAALGVRARLSPTVAAIAQARMHRAVTNLANDREDLELKSSDMSFHLGLEFARGK